MIMRGITAFLMLFALTACVPLSSKSSSGSSGSSGSSNDAGVSLGSPASDGKFQFVVISVDRSSTAGDPTNEFMQVTAKGQFINVHLNAQNTGDEAQMYFANNQKLIIGEKQFDAASILGVPGDGDNINPGMGIDTVVSFDVPPGSIPEAIELHDSAFSDGTKVNLSGAAIITIR
jgi:Domain of unknown function (DUF4352)